MKRSQSTLAKTILQKGRTYMTTDDAIPADKPKYEWIVVKKWQRRKKSVKAQPTQRQKKPKRSKEEADEKQG